MDTTTIGILGGMIATMTTVILTVVIYLDRARRAEILNSFSAMNERFNGFEQQVDKRFEQVDKRFEQVDRRFERLEQRINERFRRVDERFDEFTRIILAMANDIGAVKGHLGISSTVETYAAVDLPKRSRTEGVSV